MQPVFWDLCHFHSPKYRKSYVTIHGLEDIVALTVVPERRVRNFGFAGLRVETGVSVPQLIAKSENNTRCQG